MTTSRSAPENTTHGLTAIFGEHDVVVTGEEHHQEALQPYAPRADGRARRVAVELVPAPIARGTNAGQAGIEVRLEGRRVGELTARMAQRYGPLVVEVLRGGGRPSCIGLVDHGRRGLEVVLRLPDLRAGAVPPPVAPPRQAAATKAPWRRGPLLVGAGVVLVLGVVVANLGGGDPATVPTAAPATTVPAPTTTAQPPTSTVPPPPPAAPVAQPQPQPQPQPRPQPQPQPAPRAEPQPAARPQPPPPDPEPESDCNSNYSGGCVPNASDVDCEGGSGNGPAYVSGPVRVTGEDEYGLDSDNDGTGCE